MKKTLLLLLFAILLGSTTTNAQNFWRVIDSVERNERSFPASDLPEMPMTVCELDVQKMKNYLLNAPDEFSGKDGIQLTLPLGDGTFEEFAVYSSQTMEKELADKYPQIRSYVGKSNSSNIVHLGYDSRGFYAYMEVNDVEFIIDNYKQGNDKLYSAYRKYDFPSEIWNSFECGNKDEHHHYSSDKAFGRSANESVSFRTFRIAIAASTQYCARFGGTTVGVMEEINKAVNRINLIYRRDLASSLIIIANNEVLIDTNSNFFSNGKPDLMIDENPLFFQTKGLTLDDFDIGHVLGTNGGGLAQLYSLCAPSWSRARGVSTWASVFGDPFYVNIVAHELGHQFGSPHSFNNCNNGGNENEPTGFEPGSGHTIMSYHGLCNSDNVAGESIDMYNFYSLEVIYENLTNGNASGCGEIVNNVNTRPSVTIISPDALTIPIGTPFKLVGQGTDNETQELLTYSWEQADIGPLSSLGNPIENAPSFRVFPPSTSGTRYLPQLDNLFRGINTKEEVMARIDRDFTFRLVVRDNDPNGGSFIQDEISFKSTSQAGPFVLTSTLNGASFTEGELMVIEWDVANTDKAPVNCHFVNIVVTNDNGATFTTLAENVLNTGIAEIEVPKLNSSSSYRLMVEAADNIFFATHTGVFTVNESNENSLSLTPEKFGYQVCIPQIIEVPMTAAPIGDFDGTATLEMISELPIGVIFEFDKTEIQANDEITAVVEFTSNVELTEKIDLDIRAVLSTNDTIYRKVQFYIITPLPTGIEEINPKDGTIGVGPSPTFNWTSSDNADSYTFKIYALDGSLQYEQITNDTFLVLQQLLDPATTYFWSVGVNNRCYASDNPYFNVYSFTTVFADCNVYSASNLPTNISAGQPSITEINIEVPNSSNIIDVNIPTMVGNHAATNQLIVTLVSPSQDSAILMSKICSSLANWNLSFDDDLNTTFACTHPAGTKMKSHFSQLNNFNGKNAQGTWKVLFEDVTQGSGGRVNDFSIEVCVSLVTNHPELVTNNALNVPTLKHQTLTTDNLQATDTDNDDSDLRYIILSLPKKGHLEFYGQEIYQNGYFTQSSINDFGVVYHHTGHETDRFDSFSFMIVDGSGGYYGTGTFDINIDEEFTVSNTPTKQNIEFNLFPNPAEDLFYVGMEGSKIAQNEQINIDVYSINGSLVRTNKFQNVENRYEISSAGLASGVYLVKVTSSNFFGIKKLIIK